MKGTGLAFFSYGLDGRRPCGFLRKDDLMSGLDDHNAEEICFSMAPVRAVTRAATGFSNFPTVQPLRKPCANLAQTMCKPQARKNDSGNAGRP